MNTVFIILVNVFLCNDKLFLFGEGDLGVKKAKIESPIVHSNHVDTISLVFSVHVGCEQIFAFAECWRKSPLNEQKD